MDEWLWSWGGHSGRNQGPTSTDTLPSLHMLLLADVQVVLFSHSWQGCLADLLGSPAECLHGGWRNSFMLRGTSFSGNGTSFSGNGTSRHKLCKVAILSCQNKQMGLHVASCLPYSGCPTNTCEISSSVSEVRASVREWKPPSCQLKKDVQHESCKFYLEQNEDHNLQTALRIALRSCSKEVMGTVHAIYEFRHVVKHTFW